MYETRLASPHISKQTKSICNDRKQLTVLIPIGVSGAVEGPGTASLGTGSRCGFLTGSDGEMIDFHILRHW